MAVLRIVPNILADDPAEAQRFYGDLIGLELPFDMGWIRTYQSGQRSHPQVTFATEGGSGTPLPAISIEVDDFDEAVRRFEAANIALEYGPVDEPWGVRRFFARDPFGTLINIVTHD
ncbi:VOC family protein [Notoacmeibacter ruber]|uniref:Glyoxalase n=1 Tax=Notoacmeibacter ruber TaxID=2670375 RepID=A0A3L7JHU0_9HYPH|nr:VOC family protein [Notoacmeibacter ruber]RLQ88062.1 glyoxalase [Notoacmeibacter ruber]